MQWWYQIAYCISTCCTFVLANALWIHNRSCDVICIGILVNCHVWGGLFRNDKIKMAIYQASKWHFVAICNTPYSEHTWCIHTDLRHHDGCGCPGANRRQAISHHRADMTVTIITKISPSIRVVLHPLKKIMFDGIGDGKPSSVIGGFFFL